MRILIVDDDPVAAHTLAVMLSGSRRKILVCHDAAECLETAATFQPHVVLLDLAMPVMDGWETARRLRARQPDVVLIAVTGLRDEDSRKASEAAGFSHHLLKPVRLDTLLEVLPRFPSAA